MQHDLLDLLHRFAFDLDKVRASGEGAHIDPNDLLHGSRLLLEYDLSLGVGHIDHHGFIIAQHGNAGK